MKRRVLIGLMCALLMVSTVLAPVSASASGIVKILKVNVDGARLRARVNGKLVEQNFSLKKGERVFFAGKTYRSAYYVCTSSGKKGYVYKKFLSSYGAVNTKQVYRVTKTAGLYKKVGSGKKTNISKGKYVMVYEVRGGWAYVKTVSGKGGFMKTSCLSKG